MSLLVVGCNHRSADLALLERLAVPADELPKALRGLTDLGHVNEAVVLSTCNRVEVYASVAKFHPGLHELLGWFAERADLHPQELDELQYNLHDDRAAAHLFAVVGGLDSMVVGEQQIALQAKQALAAARAEGTAKRVLQRVFGQALNVGRRLRAETAISEGVSSVVDVGLDEVRERRGGSLAGARVALVGAGKMGALAADRIVDLDLDHVDVWNRSRDKARRLAARVGGQVVPADGLTTAIASADVVVCTTGAARPVIDVEMVAEAVRARRAAGPLVLLDLAVPRNVEPGCAHLRHVEVVDIASLRARVDSGSTGRAVAAARDIVEDEASRFQAWIRASLIEPTIRDLRARAEDVRRSETERLSRKLGSLDARERDAVDSLTRGIVNTLLHGPTVRLKELADLGEADRHADAVRDLFELDE